MFSKILIYSIKMRGQTAKVRALEIMNTPSDFDLKLADNQTMNMLLTAVAKLHLKDHIDFIQYDEISKSLSTQSFIDFNKDANVTFIRLASLESPFAVIYSIIEEHILKIQFPATA